MRRPELEFELTTISNVLVARLDVKDEATIHSAIGSGIRSFGAIHAIVNNAGFGLDGIFEATPAERIRAQFDVNLFGVMNTTRAILPHFRARQSGIVVNISSGSGVFALPAASLYCASKFALEGFSEALTYELASQGVKVKLVEPGGIFTTEFFKRTAREASVNERLPDYDEFMSRVEKFFEYVEAHFGGTEEEVCKCIYTAVTDGTDQLRYVATKDIEALIHARRETSEVEYMATMRKNFERWAALA
jgi:NAD(P)-dependent dehydrogenase (short-subunit alcohol dehydrogenase family)